ncbi:hypothetical protein ASPZODRAFT_2130661 [Penicilliopsis zonata CBS 506.65]|uniref:Trichothecene 3-O-acetyltransferase-like N-terminal domain-containing protein n=1 Tax=Penicilliopsis zonata CBS 506.65 TaxID=1073090 RepID=A0A1L9SFU2_9EURO|nr:hypothetical protein ASPZODRAFT_2130661 [Penicilliopsis zonata CBS 506.65]OJJ46036.1 hypothetical protein ASPZODRAFT_2130661 [Penicilliopsis zonata CBS 506.65]
MDLSLPFSSLDHSLVAIYVPYFFCFRSPDPQQCLTRLQAGIDLLFLRLPFLTGKVVPWRDPRYKRKGQLRIQPGNAFAAIPMVAVKQLPDLTLPPAFVQDRSKTRDRNRNEETTNLSIATFDERFLLLPRMLLPSEARPVLRFQATVLADGVVLSMIYSRNVFDGADADDIHKLLAECCRAAMTGEQLFSLNINAEQEAILRDAITTAGEGPRQDIDHSAVTGHVWLAQKGRKED